MKIKIPIGSEINLFKMKTYKHQTKKIFNNLKSKYI